MYIPFSDPKKIEKMVREIDVMSEEETLNVTILNWQGNPFRQNYEHWVKYVSTKKRTPFEVFLYWDKKTEDAFLDEITENLLSDKKYFDQLKNYFLQANKHFENFCDNFYKLGSEYFQTKTNKELINLFNDFFVCYKPVLAAYYIVYDLVNLLPRLLKKEIENIKSEVFFRNTQKIVGNFSTLGITSISRLERLKFLKELLKVQKIYKQKKEWDSDKIKKIIYKHWYEFGGCSFTHGGEAYTLEDFSRKFRKNIKINARFEIKKIVEEKQQAMKKIKDDLKKYRKYPQILKHIGWMRTMMTFRNCDQEFLHNNFRHCHEFFNEIIKRIKLDEADDFWLLSKKEIIRALQGKISTGKIGRERRKLGLTIKQRGKKIVVFTGVRKEDWHEKNIERTDKLKGATAFIGKVQGYAKIIFSPTKENKKFKPGDILITSMTTPDFVPLMRKAAAVVTDEGGLLCHAAIIAREMKKPCIIGTKIATHILKDGDLVEVDAEKGMVKILKSKDE